MKRILTVFWACVTAVSAAGPVTAGDIPLTAELLVGGLNRPVFVASPPGDYERLFIVEQRGVIRIYNLLTQTLNAANFLNIDSQVLGPTGSNDERGLLGLAFHPDYANNGFFYVNYTNNSQVSTIRRYGTNATNPDLADPSNSQILLTYSQPFSNHNGGWIGFSPNDGYLYIGTGDGGSFNDPGNRAQDITNQLLGKMLRIDVDGPTGSDIPPDNPFVGVTGDDEIWAYGLRNPWRCSFDRETGDLWIGDVGQGSWEEVDFQPTASTGGENYGWRCQEGNACTGLTGCTCQAASLTDPVQVYSHGLGCSITGGYVYRGLAMPEMHGLYFYGDWCSTRIWSFLYNGSVMEFTERTAELEPPGAPTIGTLPSFGEDSYGEIYIVDRAGTTSGEVFKIVPSDIDDQDCNGNLIVDSVEIDLGLASDCNLNDIIDACDIADGTSTDINGNGIPDECEEPVFVRGDCTNTGDLDISDPILLLDYVFSGTGTTVDCEDACDFDDDGILGLADGIGLLSYLFTMGPPPAAPFPGCGEDAPGDTLECDGYDILGCP